MTRIAAIIPVLDEEATIGAVVRGVPRDLVDAVIVADNGSRDRSAAEARAAGAEVVLEPRRGYGFACAAGARAALDGGAEVLAFLDGDGADDPADLARLVAPIAAGEADLVLGSRVRGAHAPGALLAHARAGNWLAAGLMRRLYGLDVTDLGPFRAVRADLYVRLDMREMGYGWTTEMMVKAARRGARVREVPVGYRPRAGGRSKISGTVRGTVLAGAQILATTLRHAGPRDAG